MLSSIAEAVSHSALRVLKGDTLSFRIASTDPEKLSAIGVLEADSVTGALRLRPLCLPTLERSESGTYQMDKSFAGLYPRPVLKVYLGRGANHYDQKEFVDSTEQPLRNATLQPDGSIGPFYGMRLFPAVGWADKDKTVLQSEGGWPRYASKVVKGNGRSRRVPNLSYLIGQVPKACEILPWTDDLASQGFTRGIFRGLVMWIDDRSKHRPPTKYHELFIPFTREMEADSWPTIPVPKEVLDRFHELADQRHNDDKRLPFEPLGTRPKRSEEELRLKPGDVVYFRAGVENGTTVATEVALSSIWRGRVECLDSSSGRLQGINTAAFFRLIHPELVPLNPDRTTLTLAEQLFGVVEVRNKQQQKALERKPAFAFASRLRVSHGVLHSSHAGDPWQPAKELWTKVQQNAMRTKTGDLPLKNLASPKPPCPALYFKYSDGQGGYIPKKKLNPRNHAPQGRKFYLRRKTPPTGDLIFIHPDRLNEPGISRQHQSVEQFVRPGTVFFFHIDFDNLTDLELALLTYVLQPTPSFRHQLGHGKPLGLGQIQIQILGLLQVDRIARYRGPITDPRYGQAYVTGDPDKEWPRELTRYLPSKENRQALPERLAQLVEKFRKWAQDNQLGSVLAALELLGNPDAVRHPVHYPQAAQKPGHRGGPPTDIKDDSADFERDLYQWFVQNDKPTMERQPGQFLHPLVSADGTVASSIPALYREQCSSPPPFPKSGPAPGAGIPTACSPFDLKDRIVDGCRVDAHERTKKGLRIRFAVPFGQVTLAGYLANQSEIASQKYFVGWLGKMKVVNVQKQKAHQTWQCQLQEP